MIRLSLTKFVAACRKGTGPYPLLFILSVAFLSGCSTVEELLATAEKPRARVTGVRLSDLSVEAVTLDFDVEIENPYGVALPLTDLSYALSSGGNEFLAGDAAVSGRVPARSSKTVTVPAAVSFAPLLRVGRGVRPGAVVPWDANLDLSVDAPGAGALTLPLRTTGELPIPAVPTVSLERVDWDSISFSEAAATLRIRVGNVNQFPFDLAGMDYALSLDDQAIIRSSLSESVSFGAGDERVLSVPISISPRRLGVAVVQLISGDGARYRLGGTMDVSTPYGAVDFPFDVGGSTAFGR